MRAFREVEVYRLCNLANNKYHHVHFTEKPEEISCHSQ